MQPCISITDKTATALIDKSLYKKEAAMAAAYRLMDKYSIEMRENGPDLVAAFTIKEGQYLDSATMNADMQSFFNDLLDEQLRLKLEQKTGKIRELIVKHAFSPIDLKKELGS
jgi:His-Xaa-Ser system protein HxsD